MNFVKTNYIMPPGARRARSRSDDEVVGVMTFLYLLPKTCQPEFTIWNTIVIFISRKYLWCLHEGSHHILYNLWKYLNRGSSNLSRSGCERYLMCSRARWKTPKSWNGQRRYPSARMCNLWPWCPPVTNAIICWVKSSSGRSKWNQGRSGLTWGR